MQIILNMMVNGSENITKLDLSTEKDTSSITSLHNTAERIKDVHIFQDFNSIFNLISMTINLQDIDGVPLYGIVELTKGNVSSELPFSVLSCSKIITKNDTAEIQANVFDYKILAIGIPFEKITNFLRRENGTILNPYEEMKKYFENIYFDDLTFNAENYYKNNLMDKIRLIRNNLFFNETYSTTVALVDNKCTSINFTDILKYDGEQVFVSKYQASTTTDQYNIYKSYNINEVNSKTTFRQMSKYLDTLKIKMDSNYNLDDQYYSINTDMQVANTNDLMSNLVDYNLTSVYDNSTLITVEMLAGNVLGKLNLGNIVTVDTSEYKLIGRCLTLSYDSDVIGATLQLMKK